MPFSCRRRIGLALMLAFAQFANACGGGDAPTTAADGGKDSGGSGDDCPPGDACTACEPGERLVDELCQPAGLPPDMPCPPGETLTEGTCQVAGVPPDACAPGFEHDGDGGCEPILPAARCPSGQMALMGETSCREVAPCGSAPFGNITSDGMTQFVDQNYTGGGRDGSQGKPWKTIQAGIDAAAANATVAVAAGSYQEDLSIKDKMITLWGRCPALVELVGSGGGFAALELVVGSDGSVVRGLAIRGDSYGVVSSGALGVHLQELWIHDLLNEGVHIESSLGPASLTLEGSLVENVVTGGAVTLGSELHIVNSVLKGAREGSEARQAGVIFTPDQDGKKSHGSISGSLIEDNATRGIYLEGAPVRIDDSLIRGTYARADGASQGGLIANETAAHEGSQLTLKRCVISDNAGVGIYLEGSAVSMANSVIRNTARDDNADAGEGIRVLPSGTLSVPGAHPSELTMTTSLIEQSANLGIVVQGSDADISASIIRGTSGFADSGGVAIQMTDDPRIDRRSEVSIEGSRLEGNQHAAAWTVGSDLIMHRSVVKDNAPDTAAGFGLGIVVDMDLDSGERSTFLLTESIVDGNTGGGIGIWSADAVIRDTVIRNTWLSSDGTRGMGLMASKYPDGEPGSNLEVEGTLIDSSHSSGIQVGSSHATIHGCKISETEVAGAGNQGHGIDVVSWLGQPTIATATITSTLLTHNRGAGLYVGDAVVELSASRIVGTKSDGQGNFGDGILIANTMDRGARLTMNRVRVDESARAGIANFGSWVGLRMSALSCQLFDFDAEPEKGVAATFENLGDNLCGCPEPSSACKRVSAQLEAPLPLKPPGAPGGVSTP